VRRVLKLSQGWSDGDGDGNGTDSKDRTGWREVQLDITAPAFFPPNHIQPLRYPTVRYTASHHGGTRIDPLL
jgi:hypothetical protein